MARRAVASVLCSGGVTQYTGPAMAAAAPLAAQVCKARELVQRRPWVHLKLALPAEEQDETDEEEEEGEEEGGEEEWKKELQQDGDESLER